MYYCKVLFCKYPKNHTTQGHLCMRCKKYGHGEIECKNKVLVDKLQTDVYNIYCLVKNDKKRIGIAHIPTIDCSHYCDEIFIQLHEF